MFKVCLDPGHGIEVNGKRSFDGSLKEYEFNRDIAKRIKPLLEKAGIQVIITAPTEHEVSLGERCRIANNAKTDIFVSIHGNAFGSTWNEAQGWEIFVCKKGGKAGKLANEIHKQSVPFLGLKDRGIKEEAFYVIENTNMPAGLIEQGFYTNKKECELMKTAAFKQKCAEVNVRGILNYFGIK
jgi:N-acetylmuramoyl-L-alanine amidase